MEANAGAAGSGVEATRPTLVTLATAVASSLGVLGFVTFAGGAVLWSRFKGMGLPAEHVLGLVPRSELVATGAQFLVPALGLSMLIVAIAFFVEYFSKRSERDLPRLARHRLAPFLVLAFELAISLVALVKSISLRDFALLIALAAVTAPVVGLSEKRRGLTAFGLITFLAVGTFAIGRAYAVTANKLTVMPMAYSRTQGGQAQRVEVGYFVAETSELILFASRPEGHPNELREFPRREADDLELGALSRPAIAERNAARFAYNLCTRLIDHRLPAVGTEAQPVCSAAYVEALKVKREL